MNKQKLNCERFLGESKQFLRMREILPFINVMKLKELLQFIDFESKRLKKHFSKGYSQREKVLSRTVKLMEELGEFCNEISASNNDQRKEKQEKYKRENLEEEFADVIITTLLLAESLDIDINKALENKINKIKKRKY